MICGGMWRRVVCGMCCGVWCGLAWPVLGWCEAARLESVAMGCASVTSLACQTPRPFSPWLLVNQEPRFVHTPAVCTLSDLCVVPQVCGTPDLDPKCGSQTARKLKPRSCGVCKAVVEDLEEMLLHKRDTRPDFRTKNHVSAVLEDLCESMGARHPKEEVGCPCSAHALPMLCPCPAHALPMPCPCSALVGGNAVALRLPFCACMSPCLFVRMRERGRRSGLWGVLL